MKNIFKLAICQSKVVDDKKENIKNVLRILTEAAEQNTDIAVLPEMFNCPYDNSCFMDYSEDIPYGETVKALQDTAKKYNMYIVGGSIPEKKDGKLYNTSVVYDRSGQIIGIHKKIHLYDVDIKGKIRFMESDIFSKGNEITIVQTEYCKIGIGICYDIRFPELMRIMALKGASVIIVPAAFNNISGPAHWELLNRMRAIDNQVFFATASPARNDKASYKAYGHSMVVDPWGDIIASTDEKEGIVYSDIDLSRVSQLRDELPLLRHRRTDLYDILEK